MIALLFLFYHSSWMSLIEKTIIPNNKSIRYKTIFAIFSNHINIITIGANSSTTYPSSKCSKHMCLYEQRQQKCLHSPFTHFICSILTNLFNLLIIRYHQVLSLFYLRLGSLFCLNS